MESGEFRSDLGAKMRCLPLSRLFFPIPSCAMRTEAKTVFVHISSSSKPGVRLSSFPPFYLTLWRFPLSSFFPVSPFPIPPLFRLFCRQLFQKSHQSVHLPVCERNLVQLTDRLSTPGIVTVGRVDTTYLPRYYPPCFAAKQYQRNTKI